LTGLVRELADAGFPVALTCRVLHLSRSGYYQALGRAPSSRALADAALTLTITDIHLLSRGSYGAPRVHAELRRGLGLACGRKRVARLMRLAGLQGICHRRKRGRSRPAPTPHQDLVGRRFVAEAPERLWVTDIERHEALSNRVGVGDLHRRAVAAAG